MPLSWSRTPRVVGPAVPQPGDDVVELARPAVALVVLDMVVEPEIERRVGVGGRDDVPARAAVADVVERGEPPRDMVRLVERRRGGRDQADPFRHHRQSRQQRQRLERGHRRAAPQRLDRHVQHGQMVGHEEGVERAALQRLDETHRCFRLKLASG